MIQIVAIKIYDKTICDIYKDDSLGIFMSLLMRMLYTSYNSLLENVKSDILDISCVQAGRRDC